MKIQALLLCVVTALTLSGCGKLNNLPAANTSESAGAATLNPKVYAVCNDIYTSVQTAVKENKDTQFDSKLKAIESIGQNSPQGTPNSILYEDAAMVISLDDAANAEGAPARASNDLAKALVKLKEDLSKYKAS
ncbi:hypothetical protein [Alicyclobacillus fastidiosus]|uniref:Lipoprotein n=1 Tax=Alicyclobacillus fastidiosus TaxID=392011 RepID=A0ABV5ABG5_9BACL|nr:hypothetical protein [Alicyclobacillus fastidiosus]WEH10487.1 hypothetical protein PYS47_04470 [Alicyclobacillus fastidiosus]